MEDIDVPAYFVCPISLHIMKDPVTAITGITYDRESIEHWLLTAEDASCPVTKQPLPRDSDMTPNHTLRRLIQAWCTANAHLGIDRIPTPKSVLSMSNVLKLHRQLNNPQLCIRALKMIDVLSNDDEKNRRCMAEAGTAGAMVLFIVKCFRKDRNVVGLEGAFRVLHLTWKPSLDNIRIVQDNFDLIESILCIIRTDHKVDDTYVVVKKFAILVLKTITEVASSSLMEILQHEFFYVIVKILRDYHTSEQVTKALVHVLINVLPWGRNRIKIIEAGAVFELIELELGHPGKHVTELIFCLLADLCACADGRSKLLNHAAGIAIVSKRILRISPVIDDRAVHILATIVKHSGMKEVIGEMLNVGAVARLCMVIQADCEDAMKKKAREILRLHSNVWSNSSCITEYLLTKFAGNN